MSDKTNPDRGDERYPQVVRTIRETPWAILPSALATIIEIVERRAAGDQLSDDEIRARIGAGPATRNTYRSGAVAVIPVYGMIVPRANLFTSISGGTSVQGLQAALRDALADEQIGSIVLDVHSPGGSTDLIPELAAELRNARGRKPIVAVANTLAASAAYWLAAQADEVVVTPSGEVGSIGVFAAHDDISEMQKKLGVKTTLISAGKYKTETSPFQPLSDEARKAVQERIDEFYGMFLQDVADGRGVSVDTVQNDFGEGRMVGARQALEAGMVDRIDTLEATIIRTARAAASDQPALTATGGEPENVSRDDRQHRGRSFAEQAEIAHRAISELEAGARTLRVLSKAKREHLEQVIASCEGLKELLAHAEAPPLDAAAIDGDLTERAALLRF